MMSSEKFESMEDELASLIDNLKLNISQLSSLTGEQKKNAIRQAEKKVEDANFIIQEMETEAKVAPGTYRIQMLGKLRNYRKDLEQVTKSLGKGISAGGADNFGFDREDERIEASQRTRLIQGTSSLGRASESLFRTQQIAAETDQVGVEIIDELGRQRETLERTRDRLVDTESNLSRSRKILKTMATRVMTNKMILIVIILLELGILGGMVYYKFFA
ncbi:hypothetical protein CHS0354_040163 [Potamilus streckersoni]|uniref:t-SNARE coiled-coil homology domain-containing protein n=1 Tax=Potamilus streckersoni TaxID=2493646 RepID=A0AAE0SSQ5_9BIVA|nr:hypothetical protein CHS0354_040163 [Potamilus streckersoni]